MTKESMELALGTFKYAALSQLKEEDTIQISLVLGLFTGLTSGVVQGVKVGVATAAAISITNGVYNVILNWEKINPTKKEAVSCQKSKKFKFKIVK